MGRGDRHTPASEPTGFASRVQIDRSTAEAIATSIVGQSAVVVSGILVARSLSVELRGELALILLLPLVFSLLGGLGVQTSITYHIARDRGQGLKQLHAIRRHLTLQMALLTVANATAVWLIFRSSGSVVLLAALVSPVILPFMFTQQIVLATLQGEHRFWAFNVSRVLPLATYAALVAALWVTGHNTLLGIALCFATAYATAALIGAAGLLRRPAGTRAHEPSPPADVQVHEPSPPADVYAFGRRGMLGAVFPVESFSLDQLYVGLVVSSAALGLYVIGAAFMTLPRFIAQSIGMIAYPRVANLESKTEQWRMVTRYIGATAALCAVVVSALLVLTPILVPLLFGSAYEGAVPLARILLVASLIQGIRWVVAAAARGANVPGAGSRAEVASWIVLVPALIVFGRGDPEGVALSMVLAYAASLVVLAGLVARAARHQLALASNQCSDSPRS